VAATNHDLQAKVSNGSFRADLYFRLAQYTIHLPALRERREDIAHLARRFLAETSFELRRPVQELTPPALELLERHDWPGNVRELRNVIRRAVLQSEGLVITPAHLSASLKAVSTEAAPATPAPAAAAGRPLKDIAEAAARTAERAAIVEVLRTTRGNKSQAARALQTDYKTLHVKMKHLGIRARDFAP
jgi:two-component system nitrogen regulation response regulator GlnG